MTNRQSWTFAAPKFRIAYKPADDLKGLIDQLIGRAAELKADGRLTEEGKRASFTDAAKPALRHLDKLDRATRAELARVAKSRDALRRAAEPAPPSLADRLEALEISRIARQDPKVHSEVMKRMYAGSDLSDAELRLLQSIAASHPALWGLSAAQQEILRARLAPDLGKDGEKLDADEMAANLALEALRDARVAVLKASDRGALAEEGIIPKPLDSWSLQDRVAWIGEHGAKAFAELVELEARTAGVAPVAALSADEIARGEAEWESAPPASA